MKFTVRHLLTSLLGLALVAGNSAFAASALQETFWKANMSTALDAKAKGNRAAAETGFKVALGRARTHLGPEEQAASLLELGVLLRETGRARDAIPFLEECWSIVGAHPAANTGDRTKAAMELARAYADAGHWGEAAPLLDRLASDAGALGGSLAGDLADLLERSVGPVRTELGEAAASRLAGVVPRLRAAALRPTGLPRVGPSAELIAAAGRGEPEACAELAHFYWSGRGVKPDPKRAFALLRTAAEKGNTEAEFELGECLLDGNGTKKNPAEAARWTRRAAEKRLAPAQVTLGWMFRYGAGVAVDPAEAVRWFRMAVEQGDAKGEVNLSAMYTLGLGIPKDVMEADRLCRKAAFQGEPACIWNVALAAEHGDLGTVDHAEAWAWFDVLMRIPYERHPYEEAKFHRDDVATRMSAEQSVEAKARAERYYAAILGPVAGR